jgi:hypothetical protein
MTKTVHVFPLHNRWAVKREGGGAAEIHDTQKDAIESARRMAQRTRPAQVAIHGRNGAIRSLTYGLPPVQEPPGKSSLGTKNIQKAVSKFVLDRVMALDY